MSELKHNVDEKIAIETRPALPGEGMACLQIAVGILGILLLIFPALTSHWYRSAVGLVGALGLFAGVALSGAGGFLGLRQSRQRRGAATMIVGAVILTCCTVGFFIASRDGTLGWGFPLGAIFGTLAIFSDVAAYRFRRAVQRAG